MPYDINKSLERLEKNLTDIESARNQVKETVDASEALKKVVDGYVSSIVSLINSVKSWEKDLQKMQSEKTSEISTAILQLNKSSENIISTFNENIRKASTSFKSEVEAPIEKFVNQNDRLADYVQKLSELKSNLEKASTELLTVKESIGNLSDELKTSQKGQDVVLEDIKSMVSSIKENLENATKQICNQHQETKGLFQSSTNNVLQGIAGLRKSVDANDKSTKDFLEDTQKRVDWNKWIIIIAASVIVACQLVIKYLL